MNIKYKDLIGKVHVITIDENATVRDLKRLVPDASEEWINCGWLRANGKDLIDDRSLSSYGIVDGDTVYAILRWRLSLLAEARSQTKAVQTDPPVDPPAPRRPTCIVL